MGMMNVLMQLRKVCNHPDLFEPRMIVSPLCTPPLQQPEPRLLSASPILPPLLAPEGFAALRQPLSCVSRHLLVLGWADAEVHGDSRAVAARRRQLQVRSADILAGLDAAVDVYTADVDAAVASFSGVAAAPLRVRVQKRFLAQLTQLHARVSGRRRAWLAARFATCASVNERRCSQAPVYGMDLRRAVSVAPSPAHRVLAQSADPSQWGAYANALRCMVKSNLGRLHEMQPLASRFMMYIPKVATAVPQLVSSAPSLVRVRTLLAVAPAARCVCRL